MNIIFMGTPDFAVGTLEALIKAGHNVPLVVTQPDKPKGRGNAVTMSPVKECALKYGLEVFQPDRIRKPENIEALKKYQADLIVVVAFGQILPKEILDMPRLCCVNVHASLLPKYRGAAPIQWAVINGEKVTGVTTMRMDEGLDTGDMIMTESLELAEDETGGSLFDKLAVIGAELCVKTVDALEKGTAVFTPQKHDEATHTTIIKKDFGKIDFNKSAHEIECLIRGLNPWPSAYTRLDDKMLKIWKAEVLTDAEAFKILDGANGCEETSASYASIIDVPAGMVLGTTKKAILVKCGEGVLSLSEIQLEGKKRMECQAFLLGYKVEVGRMLGN